MSLYQTIRADQILARKNKEASASVLTTLLGEAAMVGKNAGNRESTDDEVLAVIKKFVKNIDDTIKLVPPSDSTRLAELQQEKQVLNRYLPAQLTEDELSNIIRGIVSEHSAAPSVGVVMKSLQSKYAGKYDGKLASQLTQAILR